ncbi:MAG TPA: glucose-6-phosphate dehydrogenase assembly protein OpcA [Polyangia bacterium]
MKPDEPSSRLATFERGGAIEVPLGRIESELAALWRQAAEAKREREGEAPRPVTRACLWNLIVRVSGEDGFIAVKRLIDEISSQVPARAIVLHVEPAEPEQPIKAWVEANWHANGARASGSDEVTLLICGPMRDRLPALVRALVVSDAPTAMFWWGPPPDSSAPVRALLHDIDRLVVDSRKLDSERGLIEYARLTVTRPSMELVDSAWLGVRPLRGLCAGLFDPPRDPSLVERLTRVRVTSGVAGCQSRGLYTLGWLASRLGWRGLRRAPALPNEPGTRVWTATRRAGGTVTLELATELGRESHGVQSLDLFADGARFSLTREKECIDVIGPGLPPRHQPVRTHSDAELLVSALGPRGRDPIFRDALAEAARLVEEP